MKYIQNKLRILVFSILIFLFLGIGLAVNTDIMELLPDNIHIDKFNVYSDSVKHIIDVPFISQNSLYPTGCESVTTVMALNYLGCEITVDEFIEYYLDMTDIPHENNGIKTGESPWYCFLGSPYDSNGYGCYSTVIENALYKFIDNEVYDVDRLNGVSIDTLCEDYIINNTPVIIWATAEMQRAFDAETWITPNGEYCTWIAPEHCLLLVGFDDEYYYFNDPRQGKNTPYLKFDVETAYSSLYCQAVVISKK